LTHAFTFFTNSAAMPTPYESAKLNLQLFEMRRESVLRKARDWFITDFFPESVDDYFAAYATDKNPWIRMVVGYWDMAASMVTQGAIDQASFIAAHGEIIGTFSKIQPHLEGIRARFGPNWMANMEKVVMAMPDAESELGKRRARLRAMSDSLKAAKAGFL
jgi:hypothetical protein